MLKYFILFVGVLIVYVSVHHLRLCQRSEEVVNFPGTRVIEGCELLFAVGSGT